jgi:hypothetical protein
MTFFNGELTLKSIMLINFYHKLLVMTTQWIETTVANINPYPSSARVRIKESDNHQPYSDPGAVKTFKRTL